MDKDFGVLTLATLHDYRKAVGLAYTIRETSPGVPIAIVCTDEIGKRVGEHFDEVIIERSDLKGFEHKIYLDQYSPFKKTFFIDADMLVFKDICKMIEEWGEKTYAAGGKLVTNTFSTFGLNHQYMLNKLGKNKFSNISGAGHAYFEKPLCNEIFSLGRKISENYSEYANPCRYADEDVMGIAMTMLDIKPINSTGYFGMPSHSVKNTFKMDALNHKCTYLDGLYGPIEPTCVHFAMRQLPFLYAKELKKIYKKYKIKEKGLFKQAAHEYYITKILWPLMDLVKKVMGKGN